MCKMFVQGIIPKCGSPTQLKRRIKKEVTRVGEEKISDPKIKTIYNEMMKKQMTIQNMRKRTEDQEISSPVNVKMELEEKKEDTK